MRRIALGLTIALLAASSASAQVPTLFNTGVDALGNPLPNGVSDPHYTAYDFTVFGTPGALIGQAETISNGYQTYYAQNPTSRWIWANQTGNFDGAHYNTLFRTTFDLTGYDLTTVAINVSMAADNLVGAVYMNGSNLGQSYTGFFSFYSFNITSGFVNGINTLDFYAQDQGPPAAFNAYYSSQGRLLPPTTTTPEPASIVLVASGLLGVFGVARRRRNADA
jgi:hypothetical protein